MAAPDSSVVVENPEFEWDEDGRPMELDEAPNAQVGQRARPVARMCRTP
jgi:hypothetical protein